MAGAMTRKMIGKKATSKTATKKPATKTKPKTKKTASKTPKAAPKKIAQKAPKVSAAVSADLTAIKGMAKAVSKTLDQNKAEDIVTIDLTRKSALADYMIVASGRSSRQVAALARFAAEALHKAGSKRTRVEGVAQGDWVVVDGGDIVVHLFRPEVREFYQLEKLWADDAEAESHSRRSLA